MTAHVHYCKLVAHVGRHLYYACACGFREHGISATGTGKPHTPADQEWLDGADRPPKEGR